MGEKLQKEYNQAEKAILEIVKDNLLLNMSEYLYAETDNFTFTFVRAYSTYILDKIEVK